MKAEHLRRCHHERAALVQIVEQIWNISSIVPSGVAILRVSGGNRRGGGYDIDGGRSRDRFESESGNRCIRSLRYNSQKGSRIGRARRRKPFVDTKNISHEAGATPENSTRLI